MKVALWNWLGHEEVLRWLHAAPAAAHEPASAKEAAGPRFQSGSPAISASVSLAKCKDGALCCLVPWCLSRNSHWLRSGLLFACVRCSGWFAEDQEVRRGLAWACSTARQTWMAGPRVSQGGHPALPHLAFCFPDLESWNSLPYSVSPLSCHQKLKRQLRAPCSPCGQWLLFFGLPRSALTISSWE